MKKTIFYSAILFVFHFSCKKNSTPTKEKLPWRYELNDNKILKKYGFVALGYTYPSNYYPNYTVFNSDGSSDSNNGLINFYTITTTLLSPYSELRFSITLNNIDTATSIKLASQSALATKQYTLIDIFSAGKIIKVGNPTIPGEYVLLFSYTAEDGKRFNTNYFLLNSTDYIKVLSSEIYNDGSGIAKVKTLIEFDANVQEVLNNTWLPEIRHINGSMLTYFAVK